MTYDQYRGGWLVRPFIPAESAFSLVLTFDANGTKKTVTVPFRSGKAVEVPEVVPSENMRPVR